MTTTPIISPATPYTIKWELGNNEEGDEVFLPKAGKLLFLVQGTPGNQGGTTIGITPQYSADGVVWVNYLSLVGFSPDMSGGARLILDNPAGFYRGVSGLGTSTPTDLDLTIFVL